LEVEERRNPIWVVAVESPGQPNERLELALAGDRRDGDGAGHREARR
jgi:hypothetical protein